MVSASKLWRPKGYVQPYAPQIGSGVAGRKSDWFCGQYREVWMQRTVTGQIKLKAFRSNCITVA